MNKKNKYYYDEDAANRAVAFIESHVRHCKGELAGKKFKLENFSGSHAIGHTRMATESAITVNGSHPYSNGI